MTLREALEGLAPDTVLADDTRTVLRCRDLVQARGAGPPSRVALAMRSVPAAVAALVRLDGAVDELLLAPGDADLVLTDGSELPAVAPGRRATTWLLGTSGTTGPPKLVPHTLASLTRTARGGAARWGLLYEWWRFAGLQVVLQSLLSGSALLAPPADLPLRERVAALAERGCTHLSATPSLWRALLMTPGVDDLALRQVTLGGEIADQRILSALAERFPAARVTHIYAATETGVGFSVHDGLEGFPASHLSHPPSGVALEVRDGRLVVGGVDTGDVVERRGDRVLFRGRAGGVVNVGGDKVHPEEVERVLLDHPEVAFARAWARPNPISGAVVAAEVMPAREQADDAALRAELLAHCRARLPRHAVPAVLTVAAAPLVTGAGKVERR